MIKMILICAGGISTSMMVNAMKKAAKERGLDVDIIAMGADGFIGEEMSCDVLLVAPQISYRYEEIMSDYADKIKVIQMIEKKDYGTMNGAKVLNDVIERLNDGGEKE